MEKQTRIEETKKKAEEEAAKGFELIHVCVSFFIGIILSYLWSF